MFVQSNSDTVGVYKKLSYRLETGRQQRISF